MGSSSKNVIDEILDTTVAKVEAANKLGLKLSNSQVESIIHNTCIEAGISPDKASEATRDIIDFLRSL